MNKQQLQHHLHAIAQDEVQDDMNLWPEIKTQLERQPTPQGRNVFRLVNVAAMFVIIMMVGAAGVAYYQSQVLDEGIPEERLEELDISQTVNGVTLTLDWAYADAHRVNIGYSYEYDPAETSLPNQSNVVLTTADGQQLPMAFGGGGGGGGDGTTVRGSSVLNFDSSALTDTSGLLNLVLTITYSDAMSGSPSPLMGGGGGGGGNTPSSMTDFTATPLPQATGEATEALEIEPTPLPPTAIPLVTSTPIGMMAQDDTAMTFEFRFSVPFYPALDVMLTENTVTDSETTITISDVRVAPSMTKFNICFTLPESAQERMPQVSYRPVVWVDTGTGRTLANAQSTPVSDPTQPPAFPFTRTGDNRLCGQMAASVRYEGLETITIAVEYITSPNVREAFTVDRLAEEQRYFEELGYDVELGFFAQGGLYIDVQGWPESLSEQEAQGFVSSLALKDRIAGDWTFTGTVED